MEANGHARHLTCSSHCACCFVADAAFSALLPNKKRGVLPISTLTQVIRETGVEDEKVALACAQFFDVNQDCQVNFLEVRSAMQQRDCAERAHTHSLASGALFTALPNVCLSPLCVPAPPQFVERLHLACFGSKVALLESLFSLFDLDHSKQISRDEMETVISALQHNRTKGQRHETVQNLFRRADSNHDGLISLKGQNKHTRGQHSTATLVMPHCRSPRLPSVCAPHRAEFLSLAEDESIQVHFLPGLRRHFGLQ